MTENVKVLKAQRPRPKRLINGAQLAESARIVAEADNGVFPPERHAYVPHPDYALNYVHRTVDGIGDFSLLEYCMEKGINVLLRGDTGSGKTMFPMAFAAEHGLAYYSIPCDVSIEPSAMFGRMMPTGDPEMPYDWTDGPATELVRYGGVLNISEVNMMPPRIAGSLYSLLDHRRSIALLGHKGEVVNAHPKLLIVGDMNPKYRGVQELNEAFKNRWPIIRDWDYDPKVEAELVKLPTLLEMVQNIRLEPKYRTPVSTNSMLEFTRFAVDLGLEFACRNFAAPFAETERQSVVQLLEATKDNLCRELAVLMGAPAEKDLDPDEEWYESAEKIDLSDFPIEKEA